MLWFKHNADARNSLKLRKVRRKFGADGYAIYWFCLEAIAYEVDKDNLTFDLKEDAETIGFELDIQEHRVEEIMNYMVSVGLFESSNNVITCLKLAERLDKSMTNSPKMRKWLDGKSVMTLPDVVMTSADDVKTCHERVEVEVDKNKKNSYPIGINTELLESISNSWNEYFDGIAPKINLTKQTETNKKHWRKIKKILADFPDYVQADYWDGHIYNLSTNNEFKWQRDNKQLNFGQAIQLEKFERNLGIMRMEK